MKPFYSVRTAREDLHPLGPYSCYVNSCPHLTASAAIPETDWSWWRYLEYLR